MRKITYILLILTLSIVLTGCNGNTLIGEDLTMEEYLSKYTYTNTTNLLPSNGKVGVTNIGDPQVFYDENEEKYIMTGTYDGRTINVWTSDDLTTWDQGTQVFSRGDVSWAKEDGLLWGAEIHEHEGTYYLYFSIEKDGSTPRIGVASSDSIYGPYVDKGSPMFDFNYSTIDNNLFVDDDGTPYMVYTKDALDNVVDGINESHIYIVEMTDYMSTKPAEEAVELLVPDSPWEKISGGQYWKWIEGCFMHKEGDKYYLFYSANKYLEAAYSVGYAVSDSPMGPFTKGEDNPIMYTVADQFSGPGNNSLFYSKDGQELLTAYHMHTDPNSPSGNRFLNIDRIGFRPDGTVFFNGPTITNQPVPSGINEFHNLLSKDATLEVSSTKEGYNNKAATDGEVVILAKNEGYDWVSDDAEITDSYVKLSWDEMQLINSIYIYQPITVGYRALSVDIEFSNGVIIEAVELSDFTGEAAIINFNGIDATWVKITVNELGFGQTAFGLSEIMIYGSK